MLGGALLMLAAAAASPAAADDARQVATSGTAATLAPLIAARETEQLITWNPDLTDAEQEQLRAIAQSISDQHSAKLADAETQALLANLSPEDLKALAAFSQTPAAQHLRQHLPAIAFTTMAADKDFDFKAAVAKAFCAKSGKLCDK